MINAYKRFLCNVFVRKKKINKAKEFEIWRFVLEGSSKGNNNFIIYRMYK